jgi:hypothetical protein
MSSFDQFLKQKQNQPASPSQASPASVSPPPSVPTSGGHRTFAAPSLPGARPCQPILQQNPGSVWSRLEAALFAMESYFQQAGASLGIDAYIGRTNLFDYPFAVLFDCWVPIQPSDVFLTERFWLKVTLVPRPYHKYEIEYHVTAHDRGTEKVIGVFGALDAADVRSLIDHLVTRKPQPKLKAKLRASNESFDGERNEFVGTKEALLVRILGWIPIFGWIVRGIAYLIASSKGVAVRSSGRPEGDPRILVVYDSWQTVVFNAARGEAALRQDFQRSLAICPIPGLCHAVERIQYRQLDRLEEREQIVITAGRGVIYCQIYVFGTDLYLGWQSFLNRGRWVEEKLGQGRDEVTGRFVELRTVVRGTQGFSEYDYMDLNCLTEWTHAQLVSHTRQLLKNLQIDQEIDFKIIRGSRSAAGEVGEPQGEQPPAAGGFRRKS